MVIEGASVAAGANGEPLAVTYRYDTTRAEGRAARLAADDALQRALGRPDLLSVRDERVALPGNRYIDFLIPGLVGLNLMGSGMWGLGFAVVQARVRKLLKRFAATPMRRSHYLLSFMLSRLVGLVLEVAVVVGFGWLLFGVAVHGSLLDLAVVSLLGALTFAGLGLLVAARPRTIEGVSGWMNLVQLPMWLFSGAFFSYERFPAAVQPAIRVLPLTALNDALRAVINDGTPLAATWPALLVMALWGGISFAVAPAAVPLAVRGQGKGNRRARKMTTADRSASGRSTPHEVRFAVSRFPVTVCSRERLRRQPSAGDQVDREAAEPVTALVVLAGDRAQARGAVGGSGRAQRGDPGVGVRQPGGDPLEHPGAREVEAVEVGELAVGGIGHDRRLQPGARSVERQAREERTEPGGERGRRQHAAHQVGLGQAR